MSSELILEVMESKSRSKLPSYLVIYVIRIFLDHGIHNLCASWIHYLRERRNRVMLLFILIFLLLCSVVSLLSFCLHEKLIVFSKLNLWDPCISMYLYNTDKAWDQTLCKGHARLGQAISARRPATIASARHDIPDNQPVWECGCGCNTFCVLLFLLR